MLCNRRAPLGDRYMITISVRAVTRRSVELKAINVLTDERKRGVMCRGINQECLMLHAPITVHRRRADNVTPFSFAVSPKCIRKRL